MICHNWMRKILHKISDKRKSLKLPCCIIPLQYIKLIRRICNWIKKDKIEKKNFIEKKFLHY
jgi:hypothetical protein